MPPPLVGRMYSIGETNAMKVLYVGTYTGPKPVYGEIGGGQGIHVFRLDHEAGSEDVNLEPISIIDCTQPSFICVSRNHKWLYAVNENTNVQENSINVFKINDLGGGETEFVGNYDCKGIHAVFISQLDDLVFVANYTSGSALAFKQNRNDGTLNQVWFKQFLGGSRIVKDRQTGPHAHCVVHHGENRLLYICDLGADKIYVFDILKENLKPFDKQPSISLPEGSGPRHVTIHHTANFMYVACELSNTVIPFKVKPDKTVVKIQEPLSCVAEKPGEYADFPNEIYQCVSDIHLTPDGKYLYVSTRGKKNNIAMFTVDQTTGLLTLIGFESTRGRCPRNFVIDPSGTLLLCGNQDSDTIIPFALDPNSGKLSFLGKEFKCPAPVCLEIVDI